MSGGHSIEKLPLKKDGERKALDDAREALGQHHPGQG